MTSVWNPCAPGTQVDSEHAEHHRAHNDLCVESLRIFNFLIEIQLFKNSPTIELGRA